MARVTTVEKARKAPGSCGRCGTTIKVGQAYKHWSFRYGGKRIRCTAPACAPRSSDLTNNEKLSTLYAYGENFEDAISEWDQENADDLRAICDEYADGVQEVVDMYNESADAIEEGFGHETFASEEQREGADELDSFKGEIENARDEIDEFDEDAAREEAEEELLSDQEGQGEVDEDEVKRLIEDKRSEWAAEQLAKVEDLVSQCPR